MPRRVPRRLPRKPPKGTGGSGKLGPSVEEKASKVLEAIQRAIEEREIPKDVAQQNQLLLIEVQKFWNFSARKIFPTRREISDLKISIFRWIN